MKFTETVKEFSEEYMGYCTACDDITTDSVEPDAEGYICDECGKHTVMGIENAVLMGFIN